MIYKFETDHKLDGCIDCPVADWYFGKCRLNNEIWVEDYAYEIPEGCKLIAVEPTFHKVLRMFDGKEL